MLLPAGGVGSAGQPGLLSDPAITPPGYSLAMPVLQFVAQHDTICSPHIVRTAGMRQCCPDLTWVELGSGHWMAQEMPAEVNAALLRWIATSVPEFWPGSGTPGGACGLSSPPLSSKL